METPLILVIDDSPTIRKLVECHLAQAGYRVALAADADSGIEQARLLRPNLILLDHQLPGTTGDDVCRRLLSYDETRHVPILISSTLRNRAFVQYAEYPNVVDQVPKPFTPELLKSGVANALATGPMVVKAQQTGSAVPEAVGEVRDPALEGSATAIQLRSVLDFLNNNQMAGRFTIEVEQERIRFTLAAGRIQAVVSPTIASERLEPFLPDDLAELAPLLAVTLREQHDPSMSGLVRLLEHSLADPRRLRALLRLQSGILAYWTLTLPCGRFAFEPGVLAPPMFQAFPLQSSLAALTLIGLRHAGGGDPPHPDAIYARHNPRGGNLDRTGLSPTDMKLLSLLDGNSTLAAAAERANVSLAEAADLARGLELVGHVERRGTSATASILLFEDDAETVRILQRTLGPDGEGARVQNIREAVAAQLLLRRNRFDLVLMAVDRPEQEAIYRTLREQAASTTRFIGIVNLDDEVAVHRLDAMGFDGILARPVNETDLLATVRHLLSASPVAVAS